MCSYIICVVFSGVAWQEYVAGQVEVVAGQERVARQEEVVAGQEGVAGQEEGVAGQEEGVAGQEVYSLAFCYLLWDATIHV